MQTAVRVDSRVLASLQYGGSGIGRDGTWSDVKLVLYIEDGSLFAFQLEWQPWAARFGDILLADTPSAGHHRAVYETGGLPLCVDFTVGSAREIGNLSQSPLDADAVILYDRTDGRLEQALLGLNANSSSSSDPRATFSRVCADFWTMLAGTHRCLLEGDFWEARIVLHALVLPNLIALLKPEYGATGSRPAENSALDIESAVSSERFAQLNDCIPGADNRHLSQALLAAARLGHSASAALAQTGGWEWPETLAERVMAELQPSAGRGQDEVKMQPIGMVENSITELLSPKAIKAVTSRIRVYPQYVEGLEGLEGGQRLLVVFQFHRLSGFELRQHPRNDKSLPKQGVFALHSPRRPNPIGVTEVDLLKRDGDTLIVAGLDAVNGTPILDLKLNS